jgi:hypothetical protein
MTTLLPARSNRGVTWLLLTAALLTILLFGYEMPVAGDRTGLPLLVAKLRWTTARTGYQWSALLRPPSARTLVQLDPQLRSTQAQAAARWLAQWAPDPKERMRWASVLTARDPKALPLLRQAVRAGLASGRCELLRAAVDAATVLPRGSMARREIADEFVGRKALARWGSTSVKAAHQVARTRRVERAARALLASSRRGHGQSEVWQRSGRCIP